MNLESIIDETSESTSPAEGGSETVLAGLLAGLSPGKPDVTGSVRMSLSVEGYG